MIKGPQNKCEDNNKWGKKPRLKKLGLFTSSPLDSLSKLVVLYPGCTWESSGELLSQNLWNGAWALAFLKFPVWV